MPLDRYNKGTDMHVHIICIHMFSMSQRLQSQTCIFYWYLGFMQSNLLFRNWPVHKGKIYFRFFIRDDVYIDIQWITKPVELAYYTYGIMTSWLCNLARIVVPFWGEIPYYRWISLPKYKSCQAFVFSLLLARLAHVKMHFIFSLVLLQN